MNVRLRSAFRWPISTNRRRWASFGIVAGLAVPWILVFIWWHYWVPPITFFLFWPTVLFLLLDDLPHSLLPLLLALGGNVLIYGAAASAFRRYSLLIPALILAVIPLSLPPSERKIAQKFPSHQKSLERLVELIDEDRDVVALTAVSLTTADGKSYTASDPHVPLSAARLKEYRSLFQQAGVGEIARVRRSYRIVIRPFDVPETVRKLFGNDDVHVHTFADGLATYGAYVFCPAEATPNDSDFICKEQNRTREYKSFRVYRLNQNWFYLKVFRKNGPD